MTGMRLDLAPITRADIDVMMERVAREIRARRDFAQATLSPAGSMEGALRSGTSLRFNTLSLPAWTEVMRLACIDHVPAVEMGSVPLREFIALMEERPNSYGRQVREILSQLREGEMFRFEQVAPEGVKMVMAEGRGIDALDATAGFDAFDMRFMDTIRDIHDETIRLFRRPVIRTAELHGIEGGIYPQELRVIVQGGALIGVSNYYPQAVMSQAHVPLVQAALEMSARALRFMRDHDWAPCNPSFPNHPEGPSFTMDFLVCDDGRVLFLEGGPAALIAAHPCCFLDDDGHVRGDPPLHGFAPGKRAGIIPLQEIRAEPFPDLRGMPLPEMEPRAPDETPSQGAPGPA